MATPSKYQYLLWLFLVWAFAGCSGESGQNNGQQTNQAPEKNNQEAVSYEEVRTEPMLDNSLGFEVKVNHPEWMKTAAIYEVNIRQYTPEGTFRAFVPHLERLKALGVDIIWLMPIHPIGEKNRKGTLGSYYSVKDFYAVNPEFGTIDDLRYLIDKAHEMGLYVITGWIANHTAWDNPLFEEHPDWYVRDAEGNAGSPRGTDWTDVVALDVKKPAVQDYMVQAMKYWVKETNLDGYRADVAGWAPTEFWNRAREELETIKPVFMLAEAEKPILHEKAFDVSYAWHFSKIINKVATGEGSVKDIKDYFTVYAKDFPKDGVRMNFTTNHDLNSWEGTVYDRFGKAADAYFVLAATMPGMPLIYSGQEAGLNKQLEFFERDPINWEAGEDKSAFFNKLLTLKEKNATLWNGKWGGDMHVITTPNEKPVLAFYRTSNTTGDRLLVLLNLGGNKEEFILQDNKFAGTYTNWFTGEPRTFQGNDGITLPPYAYEVYSITHPKSDQGKAP